MSSSGPVTLKTKRMLAGSLVWYTILAFAGSRVVVVRNNSEASARCVLAELGPEALNMV